MRLVLTFRASKFGDDGVEYQRITCTPGYPYLSLTPFRQDDEHALNHQPLDQRSLAQLPASHSSLSLSGVENGISFDLHSSLLLSLKASLALPWYPLTCSRYLSVSDATVILSYSAYSHLPVDVISTSTRR